MCFGVVFDSQLSGTGWPGVTWPGLVMFRLPTRFGFAGSCEPERNHAGNTILCFAIDITCSRHLLPMLLCVLQRFQLKERTSAFAVADANCLNRSKDLFGLELLVHAQQYPRTFPSSTHHDEHKAREQKAFYTFTLVMLGFHAQGHRYNARILIRRDASVSYVCNRSFTIRNNKYFNHKPAILIASGSATKFQRNSSTSCITQQSITTKFMVVVCVRFRMVCASQAEFSCADNCLKSNLQKLLGASFIFKQKI